MCSLALCYKVTVCSCLCLFQMFLTVYLSNNEQHFTEVPVTPETTCRDVVELCKEPGETECHLAEVWCGSGRLGLHFVNYWAFATSNKVAHRDLDRCGPVPEGFCLSFVNIFIRPAV